MSYLFVRRNNSPSSNLKHAIKITPKLTILDTTHSTPRGLCRLRHPPLPTRSSAKLTGTSSIAPYPRNSTPPHRDLAPQTWAPRSVCIRMGSITLHLRRVRGRCWVRIVWREGRDAAVKRCVYNDLVLEVFLRQNLVCNIMFLHFCVYVFTSGGVVS